MKQGKSRGCSEVPRAKDDDGGRCREIARGRIEQERRVKQRAMIPESPTSSLLSFESSLRDGTAMDRREARGVKRGERKVQQDHLEGVKCHRNGEG